MNTVSRFNKSFVGKIVKPGTKVLDSARPEVIASSTKDKFVLNDKARKLLNVKLGDRIMLIDDMEEATTMNDRFYLVPNYTGKSGTVQGAKIGKGFSFSYSGVWSAAQMQDLTIEAAQPKDMERAGRAVIFTTTKVDEKTGKESTTNTCIATHKVAYELQEVLNENSENLHVVEEDGEATARIFALVNVSVEDHTPQVTEIEEEEVVTTTEPTISEQAVAENGEEPVYNDED